MSAASTIAGAAWLSDESTRLVAVALGGNSAPPVFRFVGGCVRNTLLGLKVDDIDIATVHTPERVIELAAAVGLKSVATGLAHGTVTVIAKGKPFEVTTLRKDVATDGRHAQVQFTDDWAGDAARRDFTMNAIYANYDGSLFDPVGGIADLAVRKVRFIGDARARIREDFLRILRFFRFHAWYGQGEMDAAGLAACAAEKEGLKRLSGERVQKELLKLLAAADPVPAIIAMRSAGILAIMLPETEDLALFERLARIEAPQNLLSPDPIRRLAALVFGKTGNASAVADRLKLSNDQRERLNLLAEKFEPISANISSAEICRFLYRQGAQALVDRTVLSWALAGNDYHRDQWIDVLINCSRYRLPKFPISGHDLIAYGLTGAKLGAVLRALEDWWIGEEFTLTRDEILARARELAAGPL